MSESTDAFTETSNSAESSTPSSVCIYYLVAMASVLLSNPSTNMSICTFVNCRNGACQNAEAKGLRKSVF